VAVTAVDRGRTRDTARTAVSARRKTASCLVFLFSLLRVGQYFGEGYACTDIVFAFDFVYERGDVLAYRYFVMAVRAQASAIKLSLVRMYTRHNIVVRDLEPWIGDNDGYNNDGWTKIYETNIMTSV
jgi:hypothetical protein